MKKKKQKDTNQVLTPRKSVSNILRRGDLSPGKASKDTVKTLLFADVASEEIRASVLERKNNRESIRRLLSGKILRKYKLIKYASEKTGNNRRKMCRSTSKNLNNQSKKQGFDPEIRAEVLKFYGRDDNSTALPGKRDAKRVKKSSYSETMLD